MNFFFMNNDPELIKKKYEYDINSEDPMKINDNLYAIYKFTLIKYDLNDIFDKIEKIIQKEKEKKPIQMKYNEKQLKKLREEYNKIDEGARDDHWFYGDVLYEIKCNCKENYYKIDTKDKYIQISKDIIKERAQTYIKNEKLLILINDKVYQLYNSLNN